MPKFRVKGCFKENAEDVEIILEATSYKDAERIANQKGILVSDVLTVEEPSSKESEPAMEMECYCENCEDDCNVKRENYLHYLFKANAYENIGYGRLLLNVFLMIITGGFWSFFMLGFANGWGFRYYCEECGELVYHESLMENWLS